MASPHSGKKESENRRSKRKGLDFGFYLLSCGDDLI